MLRREEHTVIESIDDLLEGISQRDEVDHIVILIQRAVQFDLDPVVMSMDPLADVAAERDEVPRTEDEVILGQSDPVTFPHGRVPSEVGTRTIGD